MTNPPPATDELRRRLQVLVSSHQRLTGRALIDARDADLWQACWAAPRVIVAHGLEADPIFFYGNALALRLFELDFEAFTRLPSRYSAEPLLREKREAALARVREHGFIDDYSGVRISSSGKRFRIEQTVIWDLLDEHGERHGQAASFARWVPLPEAPRDAEG
ncbi:MAG TPA: MEKHLA domain-containing protein [Polyangiaceae bacterium]|nr:MEKHLA domain-containing protein [Polyangiaceae bacterium]